MKKIKPSVERFGKELQSMFESNSFVVFLCGPTLCDSEIKDGAALRKRIKESLEHERFEVVLGEDDGLDSLRKYHDGFAHDNEIHFIKKEAGAILLVADSPGSFCELGLFSYLYYADPEDALKQIDFILLVKKCHEGEESYFNTGPAAAIDAFGGKVIYGDFGNFDIAPIVKRLRQRRTAWFTHKKGRPASNQL